MKRIFVRGQLFSAGKPWGMPVICESPREAVDLLLGEDGEWEEGGEGPMMLLSSVAMTEKEFANLPEWQGP